MREVEAGVEAERHDAGRRLGCANAGEDTEHTMRVHAHGHVTTRQRINVREVLAFYPEVKLDGGVGGSVASLPHGDDDDANRNVRGLRERRNRKATKKTKSQIAAAHAHSGWIWEEFLDERQEHKGCMNFVF